MPTSECVPLNEWFSLSYYNQCKEWDILDWSFAVSARFAFRHLFGPASNQSTTGAKRWFQAIAQDARTPTGSVAIHPSRFNLDADQSETFSSALADITDDPSRAEHFRQEWTTTYYAGDSGDLPACLAKAGTYDHGSPIVKILALDLSASDKLLERQFADWLKEVRQSPDFSVPANVTEADLRAWSVAMVLPYIDLTLWRDHFGERLTYPQIAALLFPEDFGAVDVVERVRKVTARYAERLLSGRFVQQLETQAIDSLNRNPRFIWRRPE